MDSWRQIQRKNITCPEKLSDFLQLSVEQRHWILKKPIFPLNLPLRLASKIQKRTLNDPILKQFIPVKQELESHPGFTKNPVGDDQACRTPKLLKKYEGRILLLPTSACAMNCRFCFRQYFEYDTFQKGYDKDFEFLKNDPTIKEAILSGGDPLSLSNDVLSGIFSRLHAIEHLKRVRFHSRFPIGIPERIDEELLSIFKKSSLQIWFVIHCNHPQELDEEILHRLKSIRLLGIPLLSQTVLLKGVNDSFEVLCSLRYNRKLCLEKK